MIDELDEAAGGSPAPRGRRWGRLVAAVVALVLLASLPWWGRAALSRLAFFHVRKIEIEGARYLAPGDVVARLGIDTATSVWTPLGPLAARVERHPLVAGATVSRRLPGTLVVVVTEKVPVALVPGRGGFKSFDAAGEALPIEPSRVPVDLPILVGRDTALLELLGELKVQVPSLYARVSEVRRSGKQEVVVRVATVPVRAMADVRADRLADIIPVEQDLARRQARVVELDLRYREQVIARLE